MARDKDSDALDAFKNAFGVHVPLKNRNAKIRLGKAVIALDEVKKALEWAEKVDLEDDVLENYRQQYKVLQEEAENQSTNTDRNVDMQFLEAFKIACRHLADTIRKTRVKKRLNGLPPRSGIFVNDVPGLDDLDDNGRTAKIEETRQKVCRGQNLTAGIFTNDPSLSDVAPTKETVIDMCWYFKGMAQEKLGTAYQQGALTLPDPDGKLQKFIDGCPDIYPRDSSHLRPQQQTGGAQGRGIDCNGAFPGGMNTVLFHPFIAENGERRLYVKFESAGAYSHLRTNKREVFRRPKNEEDEAQSKAHAKAFVSGGKDVDLAETREGTVDLEVQAAYQAVVDAAGPFKNLMETGKQKSKQNAKGEITAFTRVLSFTPLAPNYWDVQTQTNNIVQLIGELKKPQNRARAESLQGVILAWSDAMDEAGYKTDARIRLGDEVVLRGRDLKVLQQNNGDGDVDVDRALIPMLDLLEQRRAQQARLLEGKKDKTPYVFYKKLVFVKNRQRQEFDNVLTIDTEAQQFAAYAAPQSKVAAGVINKGTNVLKKKYFEYTGDVTQQEMFDALTATGWNLHNLTKPADLKKK
ncbi:MAG: hypothetical protein JNK76_13650 [Planctomycetales bacterium]|nr:hypothetical protein [Planctomycetales bacterium]